MGRILLVRNIFTMESDLQHAVAAIGQSDQLCKSTRAGTVGDFLTGFRSLFSLISCSFGVRFGQFGAWKKVQICHLGKEQSGELEQSGSRFYCRRLSNWFSPAAGLSPPQLCTFTTLCTLFYQRWWIWDMFVLMNIFEKICANFVFLNCSRSWEARKQVCWAAALPISDVPSITSSSRLLSQNVDIACQLVVDPLFQWEV